MNTPAFSLYDASAGSGKTYTLTKEYLKILFNSATNDAYKKILAITFTNKAVEEMKSRIIDNLYDFSKENTSAKSMMLLKDIALETGLSVATIKDKAKAIIKNIIHNYTAFGISTIDKFTHKVIRAFAQDLNLPANFEVSLDTDALLQEAVDLVISKVGEEETLTNLLIEFTKNKTDDDKNWDISKELFEVSRLITNENNANELTQFEDKTFDDFSQIKKVLNERIMFFQEQNSGLANQCFQILSDNGIDLKSFSRATFPNHITKIQEGNLESKDFSKYVHFEDIAINKTAKDITDIESVSGDLLVLLQKCYYNCSKMSFYQAFLQNINPLSLLNTIHLEFKNIQEEKNILSISDFNKIIFNEIQNQPAPFIYERLGEKYRHFFIDEFQDTSIMQWKNLIPLIDNAVAGEENGVKGTLMLVGDPKQSIYRWRGGKAEQFIKLSKTDNINDLDEYPFSNKDKEVFRLGTNYRSYSEVISFNNNFFAHLSGKFSNEDYTDLYLNHSHQKINSKLGGYVNLSFIEVPKEENEDFFAEFDEDNVYSAKTKYYLSKTLETIYSVIDKGFQFRDIVLLTRKKSDGVALANFLTENQIPILSSETLLIQNATEVKLIVNLLKYLKSNKDQESKVYVLYYVAKNLQKTYSIHDFIALTKDLSEKELELFLKQLSISVSFQNCRKKSLYEAVEIIVDTFIQEKTNTSYVQYFLDLVLERDSKLQSSISDFLDYWEKTGFQKSIPSPEGNDAIRIMTIHKSKGLEFPVVIYPFADEDFNRKIRNKIWVDFDEDEAIEFPKALVNSKKEVVEYGEKAKETYETKNQEEILDIINVLYVALTRAEEQLYVISNHLLNKSGLPDNLSSYFIEYLQNIGMYNETKLEYEFGNPTKCSTAIHEVKEQKTISLVKEKLNSSNIKITQREALMWNTEQQQAIEFGNILHEIMSFVVSKSDTEFAIQKAIEIGLITTSQLELFDNKVKQIVSNNDLAEFFSGKGLVYNEETILKTGYKNLKPDRVVIFNNEAYLLDYKTGEKNQKHQNQINEYAFVLQEMDYKVVKKALVYIGEKIEVVLL
ncbi:UvrD-helicase domain-containing protein [Flavobacterium sp.]|uniref:UvrD-helicase domain-containing protein n=1 Tax=Flavobacterium sp. TaxID=239 RepID=UPI002A7FA9E6|nr:UvrD-helicase domain-containing protein [Flavobacterium sp.]